MENDSVNASAEAKIMLDRIVEGRENEVPWLEKMGSADIAAYLVGRILSLEHANTTWRKMIDEAEQTIVALMAHPVSVSAEDYRNALARAQSWLVKLMGLKWEGPR